MNAVRSILVVDDVPEILQFFARLARNYRAHRLDMTTLHDPAEALALVSTRSFDLVVSDFRMPRINGITILKVARERNPNGKRILMTGYNEIPTSPADLEAAGLSAQLSKPIHAAVLLDVLTAALSEDPRALESYNEEQKLEGPRA